LLIYPNFSQPFIVACDVSTKAIGAILLQVRNGEERPVAYCSRQLNPAETKVQHNGVRIIGFNFCSETI
jgi:hypothetical protein